jgi:hypothetical protein
MFICEFSCSEEEYFFALYSLDTSFESKLLRMPRNEAVSTFV